MNLGVNFQIHFHLLIAFFSIRLAASHKLVPNPHQIRAISRVAFRAMFCAHSQEYSCQIRDAFFATVAHNQKHSCQVCDAFVLLFLPWFVPVSAPVYCGGWVMVGGGGGGLWQTQGEGGRAMGGGVFISSV